MALAPEQQLSQYRLVGKLGEGGMGEVWKATDTTLGRAVAIKVLPDAFTSDPERLARFEREAKVLASLSHPHIASVYGFHAENGVRFLAMELAEGENLAERMERGPVAVDDAVSIAHQVAQALEAAHDRGVVHRDLKPANVMLGPDGRVKVLDFGLAKALEEEREIGAGGDPSQSPTFLGQLTGAPVILGTAAYMSPEQARARPVDRRADIWSFGVVLFEMLTGRRLFEGETISDTLAAVLKTDPDFARLPADTPPRLRLLLERCLVRDPKRRLQDIGEARILLEDEIGGVPFEAPAAKASALGGRRWLAYAGGAFVLGGLIAFAAARFSSPPAAEMPLRRFHLSPPPTETALTMPAISPDGRRVAYFSGGRLWIHDFEKMEPQGIAVVDGSRAPFWSPDSRSVGFIAGSKVWKVSAAGGEPQVVADLNLQFTGGGGGTWTSNGRIVMSRAERDGLLEVSELGGDARTLLPTDSIAEGDFHEPFALPGDQGVIYVVHRRKGIDTIELLRKGKRKVLVQLEGQSLSWPVYSPTGHILFHRVPTNAGIWAVPFSASRGEVTGEPFLVAPQASQPSVSADGTLVCIASGAGLPTQTYWFDREGKRVGEAGREEPEAFPMLALSPDGRRIAFGAEENDNDDLWIYDLSRGTRTRLTFAPGTEEWPMWFPDGGRVVYHAWPADCGGADCRYVIMQSTDGSGRPDTLARAAVVPTVSPDGRFVIYSQINQADWDLWYIDLLGDRRPQPFLQGRGREVDARVSPAGGYVAYGSSESGRHEIYMRRFPSGEGRWQVSTSGGHWSRWNARGDRLYFVQGDDIMEVEVSYQPTLALGTPRRLFTREPLSMQLFANWPPGFDVNGDGTRFLFDQHPGGAGRGPSILVVQNWAREFRDR